MSEIIRPRRNPHLLGHEAAEALLRRAIDRKHLHHAWLLTGPKGIGKATLAHRAARYLLSRPGSDQNGLGLDLDVPPAAADDLFTSPEDSLIQRMMSGGHPDYLTVEAAEHEGGRGEIQIDTIRELGRRLRQTSGESEWRVTVVDSADQLNVNAANALLKLLEEPPAKSVLFLVCHNARRVPPTVLSRCRRLPLVRLEEETFLKVLLLNATDMTAEEGARLRMVSDGDAGQALALRDNRIAELTDQISAVFREGRRVDNSGVHDIAGAVGDRGADQLWDVFVSTALQALRSRCARAGTGEVDRWLALWEKAVHILGATKPLSLDRTQAALSVMLAAISADRAGRA